MLTARVTVRVGLGAHGRWKVECVKSVIVQCAVRSGSRRLSLPRVLLVVTGHVFWHGRLSLRDGQRWSFLYGSVNVLAVSILIVMRP